MKIIYKQGNLLDCEEKIIVHGCNAQGVMGAGVAKAIKEKWREVYESYILNYAVFDLELGYTYWIETKNKTKIIGNAIIQEDYGRKKQVYVSYDAIRMVMKEINENLFDTFGEKVFAMPKIGAGLAGGDWDIIEKIIEEELIDVQPVVYYL